MTMNDPAPMLADTAAATCARVRVDLEIIVGDLSAMGAEAPARSLSLVVGHLAEVERAPLDSVARTVIEVMSAISATLHDLQSRPASSRADGAIAGVARAMATLYPLRRALESATPLEPDALLLVRPKKKRRAILEIVPDDSEPPPTVERRDRHRVALDVDIGMQSETNFFAGFGDDVSEGGLFVATYDRLPIGTELTLSFVLPSGAHVTAGGRVAWLRDPAGFDSELHPGIGVAFTHLDEAARAAIRDYMQRRDPIFYDG